MARSKSKPQQDPSSAPESGTDRDDTTGNQSAAPDQRPAPRKDTDEWPQKDDLAMAGKKDSVSNQRPVAGAAFCATADSNTVMTTVSF